MKTEQVFNDFAAKKVVSTVGGSEQHDADSLVRLAQV